MSFEYFPGTDESEMSTEYLEEVAQGSFRNASEEFIDYVEREDVMFPDIPPPSEEDDVLLTVLTADGVKNGVMLAASMHSRSPAYDQVEALNKLGLDTWLETEEQNLDGRTVFNHSIYATGDRSYREDRTPPFDKEGENPLEFAEFFGYPESEALAFKNKGKPDSGYERGPDGRLRPAEFDREMDYVFPARMLALEYGEEDSYEVLSSLIPYDIRNDEEVLQETIEKAESRQRRLEEIEEEFGVELTSMI